MGRRNLLRVSVSPRLRVFPEGTRWLAQRLIRPEILRLVFPVGPVGRQPAAGRHGDSVRCLPFARARSRSRQRQFRDAFLIGPRRPAGDPFLDERNLRVRELVVLLRRHGRLIVDAGHGLEQGAVLRLACDHRRVAAFAAPHEAGSGAHVELALDLLLVVAMAGEALLLEKRKQILHKKSLDVGTAARPGGARGDDR